MCSSVAELDGFWAEAGEALLLFPLTEPVRRALLQLMHAALPAPHDAVRFLSVWANGFSHIVQRKKNPVGSCSHCSCADQVLLQLVHAFLTTRSTTTAQRVNVLLQRLFFYNIFVYDPAEWNIKGGGEENICYGKCQSNRNAPRQQTWAEFRLAYTVSTQCRFCVSDVLLIAAGQTWMLSCLSAVPAPGAAAYSCTGSHGQPTQCAAWRSDIHSDMTFLLVAASGGGAYVAALLLLQLRTHLNWQNISIYIAARRQHLAVWASGNTSVTLSRLDLQAAAPGGGAHAAALLLQLLRGCEDEAERVAALQGLVASLVEGPRPARAAFAALPGWEELLVELLLEGAPGVPPQVSHCDLHDDNQSMTSSLTRRLGGAAAGAVACRRLGERPQVGFRAISQRTSFGSRVQVKSGSKMHRLRGQDGMGGCWSCCSTVVTRYFESPTWQSPTCSAFCDTCVI